MKKTIKKVSLKKERITELTKQEARALNGGKLCWITTSTAGFTHKTVHGDTKGNQTKEIAVVAPNPNIYPK